jgi:hypothetical protein
MRSRNIQSLIITLLIFIVAPFCFGNGSTNSIIVNYPGARHLDAATQKLLQVMAVDLLKTSNFNSLTHSKLLQSKIPAIQQRYRKAISGHYIVISFDQEQNFMTVGGNVEVFEIVIGLNSPEYADSLFTIDPNGRVVEHAKFSGAKCMELLKVLKDAADRQR